jgi:hypothetical protein
MRQTSDSQLGQKSGVESDHLPFIFQLGRCLLGTFALFANDAAWAEPETPKLDDKIVAYCNAMKNPSHRASCLSDYGAKPWKYTVHTVPPGDGYTLCERFADNLRAVMEPPTCEVTIAPKFVDLFQTVEWEKLDPKEYPELLYHANAAIYTPGAWKLHQSIAPEPWPDYETWRSRFEEKLTAEKRESDTVEHELSRAYFDANGDGNPEWMLGYRHQRSCNPWGSSHSFGYYYFPLKDDRRIVDREIMRPYHQVLELSGGTRPIVTTIKDPRNPETRTYLLDKGAEKPPNRLTGRGQIEGQVFRLYAATHWGLGQVPAHQVCAFELRKITANSK